MVSYEEQVTTVREHLANLLEKEEEWSKAAQTLAGIDLDSGALFTANLHRAMQLLLTLYILQSSAQFTGNHSC